MRTHASHLSLAVLSVALVAACTDQPFTVDVALRVVSLTPTGNSEGFGRHRNLEVAFSEELDPASVSAESVILEELDGGVLPGTVSYSSETGTHLVTIDPEAPLKYSARYRVTLTTGIKRKRDGSPLSVKVTSEFKSEDPAPLQLIASTPSAGAKDFSRTGTITLRFSEPVKCDTLGKGVAITESFDLHPRTAKPDAVVAGAWDCKEPEGENALEGPINCTEGDPSLCTVTFVPADPKFAYEWSSHAKIALAGGRENENRVQSFRATADGGYLQQNLELPFHVENPPAFTLSAVSPASAGTGVARKPSIALTFSEPVRCATVLDPAVVGIREKRDSHPRLGGTTAPIAGSWTVGGVAMTAGAACPTGPAEAPYSCKPGQADDPCLAVFTPDAQLEWSSTVEVTLKGGSYTAEQDPVGETLLSSSRVTSHGGTLTSDITFDFRVQDPPALQVLNVLPGTVGGDLKVAPATLLRDGGIVVRLSEPVDCATVNAGTLVVTEDADGPTGSAAVPVAVTVAECDGAAAGTTTDLLTVSRTAGTFYPYSAVVELTLAGGPFGQNQPAAHPGDALESAIATSYGGQLPQDLKLTFVVEDPPALLVLHTTPGSGSSGAPLDTKIDVTFNQPVRVGSITGPPAAIRIDRVSAFDRATRQRADLAAAPLCLLGCTDTNGDGLSDLNDPANAALGSTCTCSPVSGGNPFVFQPSSRVTAQVASSATSALTTWRSGALQADYSFDFRTRNPDPLLVAWSSPSDHDSLVPPKLYCDTNGNCAISPAPGLTETSSGIQIKFDRDVDCASVGSDPAGVDTLTVFDMNQVDVNGNPVGPVRISGRATCHTDVNGQIDDRSTVVFIPDSAFRVDAAVQVTLKRADLATDASAGATGASGIRSSDWTDHNAGSSGTLLNDLVIRFKVAPEPLQIVATQPLNNDQSVPPNSPVQFTFNQQVACDASNTQLKDAFSVTTDSGGTVAVTFDCTNYSTTTHTAVWTLTDSAADNGLLLKRGATYTVTLKGGTTGPVGINGISRLVGDYVLTFRVTSTGIVLYTLPNDQATGIGPDARICAVFTGQLADPADTSAGGKTPAQILGISFVPDITGRQVQVQGDAEFWNFDPQNPDATPAGCSGTGPCPTSDPQAVPGNAVCFFPKNASYDGLPVPTRLPYAHTFTATVNASVSDETGSYSWQFSTRPPPEIRLASYGNDVLTGMSSECLGNGFTSGCVSGPQVDGGNGQGLIPNEVPVNATFTVEFAGPVSAGSLAGNIRLVPAAGSALAVCPSTPTSNCLKAQLDGSESKLTLTPVNASNQPLLLAYDTRYTLELGGGYGGVTLASGSYLQNHVRYGFRTSPATDVEFGPPAGEDYYKTQAITLVFSRAIRFSTATDTHIVLWDLTRDEPMTVQVGLNAGAPRAAIVTPTPSYSTAGSAKIVVTRGVQDYRGNPLPPATTPDADVPNASRYETHAVNGTTPSSSAISPSGVFAGSVAAPAAPCTATAGEICGGQVFTLTFGTNNGRSADRMIPATVNPSSVALSATASAGCPAGNVPLEYRYDIGTAATADSVSFFAADGYRFRSNCAYVLTVNPAQFGNVFTLAPASAPFTLNYRGDTAAPTLAAASILGHQVGSGTPVALQGANNVRGDSAIVLAFNEPMDASSFLAGNPATTSTANVVITETGSGTIATGGTFALDPTDGRRVSYTPAQPWTANALYTVQVRGGVNGPRDAAGNRLAANVSTGSAFRADNTAPTVTIGAIAAGAVPNQRAVQLSFSEPMSAASITGDTFDGANSNAVLVPGSVRLKNTATNAYIATCISTAFDGLSATVSTCDSWLPAGTPVEVEVVGGASGVKDRAGNALATSVTSTGTL